MRTMRLLVPGTILTLLGISTMARANTEPPAAFDARAVGMGSTGVAHVHNGASLYFNPAALEGISRGAVTLDVSPLAPKMNVPLGATGGALASGRGVFPMFLVGGAYRVSQRLVLGLAVFPTTGFGAEYTSVPALGGAKLKAQLAAIEIAPGASYALTDSLSIGATYRVPYMSYGTESPVAAPPPAPPGTLMSPKVDLSGLGFLGVQLGVFARPTPTTRLGLTYRSKASVNMTGTTKVDPLSMNTEMEFASPHTFKLGVAQSLLEGKLLLALDARLSLYRESNKELVVKTDVPGAGTVPTTIPLKWRNIVGVYAGAEYRFAPSGVAARLGYSLAQSATLSDYAQPILPPPGLQHAIHVGTGVALSSVDVDLGGFYMFGGKTVSPNNGNPPGEYRMDAIQVALSGTYRW